MDYLFRTPIVYNFDTPLDRSRLSTMKWEAEIQRTQDPSLLCFGTAEMDFRVAPPIRAALQRVVDEGHFGYPLKRARYFDAIPGFYQRTFQWTSGKAWV